MKSMYVVAFETLLGTERMYFNELHDAISHYIALRNNKRTVSLYRA